MVWFWAASALCQTDSPQTPDATDDQLAWARHLTGVVLEGHFTVDDPSAEGPPQLKAERYEIRSVRKLPTGNLWLFEARIAYGEFDVTVPMPLPVEWAGSTPVITLDAVTIPGLGTFDARVMMVHDGYAGTWRHDKVSGHLFGQIVPLDTTDAARDKDAASEKVRPKAVTDE